MKEPVCDQLRDYVGDADIERSPMPLKPAVHGIQESLSQRKDLIGLAVDQLAKFRGCQPTACAD